MRLLLVLTLAGSASTGCKSESAGEPGGTSPAATGAKANTEPPVAGDAVGAAATAAAADTGTGAKPKPRPSLVAAVADLPRARFEEDLRFIARERKNDTAAHDEIADRCAERFAAAGFEVERQTFSLDDGSEAVNVIGFRAGRDPDAAAVVLGAHYDHIAGCAGADDNASGTAVLLTAVDRLGGVDARKPLLVACWDGEEEGLLGSEAHAAALAAAGREIELAVSLDAVGFTDMRPNSQSLPDGLELIFPKQIAALDARERRGDFIGAMYDDHAAQAGALFVAYAGALKLPVLDVMIPWPLRLADATAQLRRSDHASFWRHEVPAMLINDTANFRTKTYHCWEAPDLVETLDLDFAFRVAQTTTAMVAHLLEPDSAGLDAPGATREEPAQ